MFQVPLVDTEAIICSLLRVVKEIPRGDDVKFKCEKSLIASGEVNSYRLLKHLDNNI